MTKSQTVTTPPSYLKRPTVVAKGNKTPGSSRNGHSSIPIKATSSPGPRQPGVSTGLTDYRSGVWTGWKKKKEKHSSISLKVFHHDKSSFFLSLFIVFQHFMWMPCPNKPVFPLSWVFFLFVCFFKEPLQLFSLVETNLLLCWFLGCWCCKASSPRSQNYCQKCSSTR